MHNFSLLDLEKTQQLRSVIKSFKLNVNDYLSWFLLNDEDDVTSAKSRDVNSYSPTLWLT